METSKSKVANGNELIDVEQIQQIRAKLVLVNVTFCSNKLVKNDKCELIQLQLWSKSNFTSCSKKFAQNW